MMSTVRASTNFELSLDISDISQSMPNLRTLKAGTSQFGTGR